MSDEELSPSDLFAQMMRQDRHDHGEMSEVESEAEQEPMRLVQFADDIFAFLDKDGDGQLTIAELVSTLHISRTEAAALVEDAEQGIHGEVQDRQLTAAEFRTLLGQLDDSHTALSSAQLDRYQRAFQRCDRDNDGSLSVDELLEDLGLSKADATELFELADVDHSGELDFDEFVAVMALTERTSAKTLRQLMLDNDDLRALMLARQREVAQREIEGPQSNNSLVGADEGGEVGAANQNGRPRGIQHRLEAGREEGSRRSVPGVPSGPQRTPSQMFHDLLVMDEQEQHDLQVQTGWTDGVKLSPFCDALFEFLDVDGDAFLTVPELVSRLHISRSQALALVQDAEQVLHGEVQDSRLSKTEFKLLLEQLDDNHVIVSDAKLKRFRVAFDHCDKDGDGRLSIDELLEDLGVSEEEANELFKLADVDNNGELDFSEFVSIMALTERTSAKTLRQLMLETPELRKLLVAAQEDSDEDEDDSTNSNLIQPKQDSFYQASARGAGGEGRASPARSGSSGESDQESPAPSPADSRPKVHIPSLGLRGLGRGRPASSAFKPPQHTPGRGDDARGIPNNAPAFQNEPVSARTVATAIMPAGGGEERLDDDVAKFFKMGEGGENEEPPDSARQSIISDVSRITVYDMNADLMKVKKQKALQQYPASEADNNVGSVQGDDEESLGVSEIPRVQPNAPPPPPAMHSSSSQQYATGRRTPIGKRLKAQSSKRLASTPLPISSGMVGIPEVPELAEDDLNPATAPMPMFEDIPRLAHPGQIVGPHGPISREQIQVALGQQAQLGASTSPPTRPTRRVRRYDAAVLCICYCAVVLFLNGLWIFSYVSQTLADGLWHRLAGFALMPMLSLFALFAAHYVLLVLRCAFGPLAHTRGNSTFFSAVETPPQSGLPHVTIQMPIFKESFLDTVLPSIRSVMLAMKHYHELGGTANLFVNDDGLDVIDEEERHYRLQFYQDYGVGFVGRPAANRKGLFKKASNMNYCLNLARSCQRTCATNPNLSLFDAVLVEHETRGGEFWGGGDVRVGEVIFLVDADTRVPFDCIGKVVGEFEHLPVGFVQCLTTAMRSRNNHWENMIATFTNNIYQVGILLSCAGGELAPLVGHNAFIRTKALYAAARPAKTQRAVHKVLGHDYGKGEGEGEGVEMQSVTLAREEWVDLEFWSESHVSEDFNLSFRLHAEGFIGRYVTYTGTDMKEGVSLTFHDEVLKLQKYAYGACEMMFHPFVKWLTHTPFTWTYYRFLLSGSVPWWSKVSMTAYLGTYLAMAYGVIGVWASLLLWIFFADLADEAKALSSLNIMFTTAVIFAGAGTICTAVCKYRMDIPLPSRRFPHSLPTYLYHEMSFIPYMTLFWGGLQWHLFVAVTRFFLSIPMSWTATNKRINFHSSSLAELARTMRRHAGMYATLLLMLAGWVFLVFFYERRYKVTLLVPFAVFFSCHVLAPVLLNPIITKSWGRGSSLTYERVDV